MRFCRFLASVFVLFLLMECSEIFLTRVYAGDPVEINETNFPDDNFRYWLLKYDYIDEDGCLSDEEISSGLCVKDVNNFAGLEKLQAIRELEIESTTVTELDLSSLRNISDLYIMNAPELTRIIIGNTTNPVDFQVKDAPRLSNLSFSEDTKLDTFCLTKTAMGNFDLSRYTDLRLVYISGNSAMRALNLGSKNKLNSVRLYDTSIETVDVSNSSNITLIDAENNSKLQSLDLSTLTKLEQLYCSSNALLSSVNLSGCTKLTRAECVGCNLSQLLLPSSAPSLTHIDCSNNKITGLDVSGLAALTYLNCNNNRINQNTFVPAPSLETLLCANNLFTSLENYDIDSLESLDCSRNNIPSLDLDSFTNLVWLNCDNSNIRNLDLNDALTELYCKGNDLTELDVSDTDIEILDCTDNELEALDVSGMDNLYTLFGNSNFFEEVDISDCGIEDYIPDAPLTEEEIRELIEHLQPGSGLIISLPSVPPEGWENEVTDGVIDKNNHKIYFKKKDRNADNGGGSSGGGNGDSGDGDNDQNHQVVPSDNLPMDYVVETRSGYEAAYNHTIPFYGKAKVDVSMLGDVCLTIDGVKYKVSKIKYSKKKGVFQIVELEGADKELNKRIRKETKGKNGLPLKYNPYYVSNRDTVTVILNNRNVPRKVKILLNNKEYKAKKGEWSYDSGTNLIIFTGKNLNGSYQVG